MGDNFGCAEMIRETLGDYRFTLQNDLLLIETSRTTFQKAYKDGKHWIVADTAEMFTSLRELWEYMSTCISEVRDILWSKQRCDEYFRFIDSVFRETIDEIETSVTICVDCETL